MTIGRPSLLVFALVCAACSAAEGSGPQVPARGPAAPRLLKSEAQSSTGDTRAADPSGAALAEQFSGARSLETLRGDASYYSDRLAGHRTASGAPYEPAAYTAAHRKLPLGTVLRVTRQDDGRVVYVRVNDRGPFGKHRILDLSHAAAEQLGMLKTGVVAVRAEVVAYGETRRR